MSYLSTPLDKAAVETIHCQANPGNIQIAPSQDPGMASPRPSAFMKLPPEVRNIIYEYCLVVQGCITPYKGNYNRVTNQDHTSHDFAIGLLAVDKVIGSEAAAIFYGKNMWRITIQESYLVDVLAASPTSTTAEELGPIFDIRNTIWDIHRTLFRRVLIRTDRYDTVGINYTSAGIARSPASRANSQSSPTERMEAAHSYNFDLLHECWASLFSTVLDMPNLVSITFDVSHLLCLNGCCRLEMLRELFVTFNDCWEDIVRNCWGRTALESIRAAYIVGLKSALEEAQTTRFGYRRPLVPWVTLAEGLLVGDEEKEKSLVFEDYDWRAQGIEESDCSE